MVETGKIIRFAVIAACLALLGLSACSDKPTPAPEVSINPDALSKQKRDVARTDNSTAGNDDSGAAQQSSTETSSPKEGLPEGHPGGSGEKHQIEIVVPDGIKGKWDAVKLSITDRKTNTTQTVTVKLGSECKIADSSITVSPVVFLPDFRMDSLTITSVSNELNNPAVNVIISDSGKELFKGWLYSKYPDVHPFQHDRFSIVLVEAVMPEARKN